MVETIIPIKGAVTYQLTLDPTVWIFDDRKLDLTTYFDTEKVEEDNEKYLRDMGAHWSREIMEGAVFPPTLKTERKFDRKGMLTGTFGMEIKPFLNNAEILPTATEVVFECAANEEISFPLEQVENFILKFSQDGKPLTEDGPVHILFGDGSNRDNPIKNIRAIRIQ
ncbi:MAG: peptidyl-prolyl cis-trans isomerase [Solibacillus sp.]|uniref:peptidyl-prolyl cis-trans isomerase n=1 Tax=unclassified Solibacillus TaxID=2637870 RepID=UPI0030FA184B